MSEHKKASLPGLKPFYFSDISRFFRQIFQPRPSFLQKKSQTVLEDWVTQTFLSAIENEI